MWLLDNINAVKEINKIKDCGYGNLSISQITNCIVNLYDAKMNLNKQDYIKICNLYNEYKKCKTKIKMNKESYIEMAIKIIKDFDSIAPYIKYSGGNEKEFSIFMEDLKEESKYDDIFNYFTGNSDFFTLTKEELEYVKVMVENFNGLLNEDCAKEFMRILLQFPINGKEKTLIKFDNFVKNILESQEIENKFVISYLLGLLNSNKVINENEMKELDDKYGDDILKFLSSM